MALTEPNSIVLTENLAKKYFGDEDPIGKVINLSNIFDCKVTAVIQDVPRKFPFKIQWSYFTGIIQQDYRRTNVS